MSRKLFIIKKERWRRRKEMCVFGNGKEQKNDCSLILLCIPKNKYMSCVVRGGWYSLWWILPFFEL